GKAVANVVEQPAVDLVNDLEMSRDEELHPIDRPALERLGQQRMVGVGERALCDIESFFPPKMRLIKQNAHKLRPCQGRVGVVHLIGCLGGPAPPVRIRMSESTNDIAERTCD